MIPVYVPCAACRGNCHTVGFDVTHRIVVDIQRCRACDGLGRQWAPGAPAYGCIETLADREPGEIVTLGNGQRAKILWHLPYKRDRGLPHTTFLDLLEEFSETETHLPVGYPSCVGVSQVDNPRMSNHGREDTRAADYNDPMLRRSGALL